MATIRDGNKSALIVVDVQVGVMDNAWEPPRVISNVARAVERARMQGVPVIWVQHSDKQLSFGSPEWQWVPELVRTEDEPLIHKQFESSFENTKLEEELATRGVSHIVFAGAAPNWCIRATAYGALDRGYDLTPFIRLFTGLAIATDTGLVTVTATVVEVVTAPRLSVDERGHEACPAACRMPRESERHAGREVEA